MDFRGMKDCVSSVRYGWTVTVGFRPCIDQRSPEEFFEILKSAHLRRLDGVVE